MNRSVSVGVLAVLALAACGDSEPSAPSEPNTVLVTSNQFTPAQLTTTPGSTVTWLWQSGEHDLTFEDGIGNVGVRSSGSSTRNFGAAGTFRYRCVIHSSSYTVGMVGSVQVQ